MFLYKYLSLRTLSIVIFCSQYTIAKPADTSEDECNLSTDIIEHIASYANITNTIVDYFTKGNFKGKTWQSLANFVDIFGNRIAGSQNLENAIDYMINKSIENNLENIHTEDVKVPQWIRGKEYAKLLYPRKKNLPMLGLGLSIGTPPEGITANAIVVKSFEELRALPDAKVAGKIVVYDQPYVSYGITVKYRSKGASEAAKKGAVAALVRSITPYSHSTPHTGMQSYDANVTKIPVAAITHEDADFLWRLQKRNKDIKIKLFMSATQNEAISRNTIVELKGATQKEKIVIVSGHIDSWDVGDGSLDDGGGAFISWIAPIALKNLDLRPKRTLRTILWTAEEEGLVGSAAYEKQHKNESDNFNFVMESDYGTFKPLGLIYAGSKQGECMMIEILKLFTGINATSIQHDEPGPDIGIWTDQGIPGGGLLNDNKQYFWYHHSEGDRINVLNSDVLDEVAAFWTGFSFIVADIKYDIPRV